MDILLTGVYTLTAESHPCNAINRNESNSRLLSVTKGPSYEKYFPLVVGGRDGLLSSHLENLRATRRG
jgi:hypothetical protein